MKNSTLLLAAVVALLLAYGCKKEEKPYVPIELCNERTNNLDTVNKYIHGTWEWAEELRCSRSGCQYLTPKTPGMHRDVLKLSNDTARFYRDGRPDSVYKFRIQKEYELSNYPPDTLTVIAYYSFHTGSFRTYVPVIICKNQLLMMHQLVSSYFGERIWIRR